MHHTNLLTLNESELVVVVWNQHTNTPPSKPPLEEKEGVILW